MEGGQHSALKTRASKLGERGWRSQTIMLAPALFYSPYHILPFRYAMLFCILLFKPERLGIVHCRLPWWNVKKNLFYFLDTFFWRYVPAGVPGKCAERSNDLTEFITRTHAYPVAYGGFSDVWKCELQLHKQSRSKMVAVKAIRSIIANEGECEAKNLRDIQREYNIWAKLRHRNIVPLYGTTLGFGRFPAFVCPWAENGTLTEYLEKRETRLNMKERMTLLADIAAGLQYLHSCNVAHGDLSGANVLIEQDGRACLTDFGLSTLVEQFSPTTVEILLPGNFRWAAPELFKEPAEGESMCQLLSRGADIYSFGSIMLQTLSGKLPFHGVHRDAQIVVMISSGDRPRREHRWDGKDIPDELWDFIQTCWESRPSERPTSEEVVTFIEAHGKKM